MRKLFDRHIELIENVNNTTTEDAHYSALEKLEGFRDALDILGELRLVECDNHFLSKGINRPMCCGVFLDWEPK